jgi:hypothetical protein
MTDWLMKLGLGGVQRFIAQSRKTNDLRVGSRLISDLARAAGVYADEQLDAMLMRPSRTDTQVLAASDCASLPWQVDRRNRNCRKGD